ncbi:putative transcription factor interactor and regulator CCHC(Zn) family [Helianthus annuus]|nr:putative transcription factor interactor and regulator CCHC(Zn) family [Helianthus annuus]
MESTFLNFECPNNRKVRYATGRLLGNALTWWNAEKNTHGEEVAVALTWEQLKEIMKEEFCPQQEIKNLEDEFWALKQIEVENMAYNKRFHELTKMAPYLFTPLTRLIQQYIKGLPAVIKDTVEGSKPATLEGAMRLAGQLTENRVQSRDLKCKGDQGSSDKAPAEKPKEVKETKTESSSHSDFKKKRKGNGRNYAVTTNPPIPAVPLNQVAPTIHPNKKPYTGPHPQCNTCQYHHQPTVPCRLCANCGRYGHLINTCRTHQNQVPPPTQNMIQPYQQSQYPMVPYIRACFNCGDPIDLRNTCPRLVNIINTKAQANPVNQGNQANPAPPPARGRAYNINANPAEVKNNGANKQPN